MRELFAEDVPAAEAAALAELAASCAGEPAPCVTEASAGLDACRVWGRIGVCIAHGHVVALAARGCGLAELPASVAALAHLELLDLSDNQLGALPDSLGELGRLHRLFL